MMGRAILKSSHTYNLDTANELCAQIIAEFHPCFTALKATLEAA